MENIIEALIKESILVKERIIAESIPNIQKIVDLCINTLRDGGKIILCGNGGSAADCQHIATELLVRFKKNRKSLPAIALTTNTSTLTACGNDFGFNAIFSRQLESLGNKNDLLLAISTSGKSKNIIEAVKKAKVLDMKTIAFTGENGGDLARSCDLSFIVPSRVTARIQEAHACVGHIICELIEDTLG
ncbi:SIS domain-containing protein [Candidatus Omnitrophota bacterium]